MTDARGIDMVRTAAMLLLQKKERSEKDLATTLGKMGFAADAVADVVAGLKKQGFLDERRFVETEALKLAKKGYGPLKIAIRLEAQGIGRNAVEEVLRRRIPDEVWLDHAARLLDKHFKGESMATMDPKTRARAARYLASKGFEAETVRQALGPFGQE